MNNTIFVKQDKQLVEQQVIKADITKKGLQKTLNNRKTMENLN